MSSDYDSLLQITTPGACKTYDKEHFWIISHKIINFRQISKIGKIKAIWSHWNRLLIFLFHSVEVCPSLCPTVQTVDQVTFSGPPRTEQILWPRHCVQQTWGAQLHQNLKLHDNARRVYKGTHPDVDSYSAFFDNQKLSKTCIEEIIRKENVDDLFICGIATDVCVGSVIRPVESRTDHLS